MDSTSGPSTRTSSVSPSPTDRLASGAPSSSSSSTNSPTPSSQPHIAHPTRHALAALDKDFPKPEQEIDVAEALKRTPGLWTIQGQREANKQREKRVTELEAERRSRDKERMEQLGKDLKAWRNEFKG